MPRKPAPQLTPTEMLARLQPPTGKVSIVFDSDTYNEVDDQFALAYSLLSPKHIDVEAVYAAPFFNNRSTGPGDGMEKSYQEILRVFDKLGMSSKGLVYRGSKTFMGPGDKPCDHNGGKPVDSPAARDLIKRGRARNVKRDGPLYVVAIGAPTNVASAIAMAPDLVTQLVVVWLGGQPHAWPHAREFNCAQDIPASQVLFDSGVPFVQIPCATVAELLATTMQELNAYLKGKSAIGDYLCEIVGGYHTDHFAWSKVIWDISAPAWLINAGWLPSVITHSPILTERFTVSVDLRRHFMRVVTNLDRDGIYRDVFTKLAAAK
ncbi:MAG TPA: nucleoside hydrolase [Planctomycetota bacterium]|nr:nucleoside hydrolase [Planctomycetota bacterium]